MRFGLGRRSDLAAFLFLPRVLTQDKELRLIAAQIMVCLTPSQGEVMPHTRHELADEFPDDHDILHALKLGNQHFVTLAERYHTVNGEIHRIEAGIETPSDDHAETLKKTRLALLDEISALIAKAKST